MPERKLYLTSKIFGGDEPVQVLIGYPELANPQGSLEAAQETGIIESDALSAAMINKYWFGNWGTESSPGLSWSLDENSGWYNKADGNAAYSVNGTTVFEWNSSRNLFIGNYQIHFRDSALTIGSPSDGQLDIDADVKLRLDSPIIEPVGDILFATDNTEDIGAAGATRPRTGYFGTNVLAGGFLEAGGDIFLKKSGANSHSLTGTPTGARVHALQDITGTLYETGGTDVAVADGGTGSSTAAGARSNLDVPSNAEAILDTIIDAKGDLIVGTAADTPARLAVGTNDQILTADSAQASGVKWATPAAAPAAATQAEQEAGSSTTVYTSPGRQQYHPSAAKAWIYFTGTGIISIDESYNVTSITDNGTGDYTVNWATDFSNTTYALAGMCRGVPATATLVVAEQHDTIDHSVGSARFYTVTFAGTPTDAPKVSIAAFGDQ